MQFTHHDLAMVVQKINAKFSSEIMHQRCIKNIIDYQYYTFTVKIQIFEGTIVCLILAAFQMRLFTEYDYSTRGAFTVFIETIAPCLLIILELL